MLESERLLHDVLTQLAHFDLNPFFLLVYVLVLLSGDSGQSLVFCKRLVVLVSEWLHVDLAPLIHVLDDEFDEVTDAHFVQGAHGLDEELHGLVQFASEVHLPLSLFVDFSLQ